MVSLTLSAQTIVERDGTAAEATISLARPADLGAIVALTEAAYRPYTELFGAPPLPVTEDYAPHIARGEVWLLDLAGELAGLIVLEREADHLLIYSVAVAPAFQGKGCGLRLLDWAEEQARAGGLNEVRLYTNARMTRNIALYKSVGYTETGRRPHPTHPDRIVVDMAKRIDT